MSDTTPFVTVAGSFSKQWPAIRACCEEFTIAGACVLSPRKGEPVRKEDGFIYLDRDKGSPWEVETEHLKAIRRSDLMYIVSPDGYVGPSVALEIGFAHALSIPVWASHEIIAVPHRDFVSIGTVTQALDGYDKPTDDTNPARVVSIPEAQAFVRVVSKIRGFDDETPQEIFMLLVEELGELAKAMRSRLGLSMSGQDKSSKVVRLELADCFTYLLHFANQTDVDLLSAFREKERLNAKRTWRKKRAQVRANSAGW